MPYSHFPIYLPVFKINDEIAISNYKNQMFNHKDRLEPSSNYRQHKLTKQSEKFSEFL